MIDKLLYERKFLSEGKKYVAGVDEVGRGPLAGPVVCCAVIMPLKDNDIIEGVDDSKKLSESKREKLAALIREKAIAVSVAEVSPEEIDEINILNAVKKCMTAAVNGLTVKPDITIVDGCDLKLGFNAEYVVKGDLKSYTVGCASIVAKVYRDEMMKKLAEKFPAYGFEKHKGYGTAAHIKAIKENGPCSLHRKTFIKNFWAE
ncbi:MAG TPA: ribonuclease HII [Clostridiales bacterium]|nr:ribonuclease HII [Clostridiales bacterium]